MTVRVEGTERALGRKSGILSWSFSPMSCFQCYPKKVTEKLKASFFTPIKMGLKTFPTSQGSNEYDVYAKVGLLTIESQVSVTLPMFLSLSDCGRETEVLSGTF